MKNQNGWRDWNSLGKEKGFGYIYGMVFAQGPQKIISGDSSVFSAIFRGVLLLAREWKRPWTRPGQCDQFDWRVSDEFVLQWPHSAVYHVWFQHKLQVWDGDKRHMLTKGDSWVWGTCSSCCFFFISSPNSSSLSFPPYPLSSPSLPRSSSPAPSLTLKGNRTFIRNFTCRFCYQLPEDMKCCDPNTTCNVSQW